MDEMKDLIVNLSGDYATSLRELYYRLNLDRDSTQENILQIMAYQNKGIQGTCLHGPEAGK
jgi:hypothetical protein